ncbi:MAG: polyprenyl synthetase family protein [Syntrophomonadaceae bacterium]|nr:polyprenyl synthetase family protein [Syntrophomonadaceae bacterium]
MNDVGAEMFGLVNRELKQVEAAMLDSIDTEIAELREASVHLVRGGGKRMRPAFALLSARLFMERIDSVIPMATALELIHMATLVHDDVIDDSVLRRGRTTVKATWGNRVSVYAGNYILARAMALTAQYQRQELVEILALASMDMCVGEFRQMESGFNPEQGLKDYLRRIQRKTALLISISCKLGAMLSPATAQQIKTVERYGHCLGMAFQITDDVLDYVADEKTLGKPTGSDIRQGLITLPALYALEHSPERGQLRAWMSSPELTRQHAEEIIDGVIDSGGIDYSLELSEKYALRARKLLEKLPPGEARDSLARITDFVVHRSF